MTFGKRFKEVYIHLVEGEPAFLCTVRYGGFLGKSRQFRLEMRPEAPSDLEDESSPIVRTSNRFGARPQGER